jgi:hypothetical protein
LKARFLSRFAKTVLTAEFDTLAGKIFSYTAVLDWRSRRLERIGP